MIAPEHVSAELRRFRFVEEKLRDVRDRLGVLREQLDYERADTLERLCTEAIDAIS